MTHKLAASGTIYCSWSAAKAAAKETPVAANAADGPLIGTSLERIDLNLNMRSPISFPIGGISRIAARTPLEVPAQDSLRTHFSGGGQALDQHYFAPHVAGQNVVKGVRYPWRRMIRRKYTRKPNEQSS